ncbi:MAG TPA: VOC family protein [Acidimicrobiales bacterium]|nr:VOC family protein [Acidimicrobiales bacterium]
MASRLNPYIAFGGNAKEAIEHYQKVFGGELVIHTYAEFGTPADQGGDKVMHAQLETPAGLVLMAGDMPPGTEVPKGGNVSISLSGEDETELRGYWDNLSDGGNITMPIEKQMWGDIFGMFTDRFGVDWMVNISQAQG